MRSNQQWTVYSFLKVSEGGGTSQREMLALLKSAGIKAERWSSPYIGHTAVLVYGGEKVQKKASRIILG